MIYKLKSYGVSTKQNSIEKPIDKLPLEGKTFVVTGTLNKLSRTDSEELIRKLGGKVTSSVTRNTDYVVVGESPGSKLESALHLGTDILDEAALLNLLDHPPA